MSHTPPATPDISPLSKMTYWVAPSSRTALWNWHLILVIAPYGWIVFFAEIKLQGRAPSSVPRGSHPRVSKVPEALGSLAKVPVGRFPGGEGGGLHQPRRRRSHAHLRERDQQTLPWATGKFALLRTFVALKRAELNGRAEGVKSSVCPCSLCTLDEHRPCWSQGLSRNWRPSEASIYETLVHLDHLERVARIPVWIASGNMTSWKIANMQSKQKNVILPQLCQINQHWTKTFWIPSWTSSTKQPLLSHRNLVPTALSW